MSAQEPRLQIIRGQEVTQIGFRDRNILDETKIQQISDQIGQVIDQTTAPKILIDFQGVEHLSSAALGVLIAVNNRIRQKGGQLRLAGIDKQIYEVFTITKLSDLFQIHEGVDQALASFK